MEQKIKYGLIHCHTENSLKDSTLTPDRLCERAAELGAPAVVLTDHGVLTGVYEFMHAAEKYQIKGIPGVEAYVQEDDDVEKRKHMVLIPKDYAGYQAISKAVTKSNTRFFRDKPCMNLEILRTFFGEGSKGHGHVIATSACVGGVLSQILLQSDMLQKEIEKLKNKQSKYSNPNDPAYLANKKKLKEYAETVTKAMARRDDLDKTAGRKFRQKEKGLETIRKNHPERYDEAKEALDAEKAETEQAAVELANAKSLIAKTKKNETLLRGKCKEAEKSHSRWKEIQDAIDSMKASIKPERELFEDAKHAADVYRVLFGNGNFYVELQYHMIEDEMYVMPRLAILAKEMGLPVVACNDVHYSDDTPECVRAREIVNSLRFNKWEELRPGDTEYYIKSDDELRDMLQAVLNANIVEEAMKGIGAIVEQCNVEFPKETHYPKFISDDGESAKDRLRRLAQEGIAWRYPSGWTKNHEERLDYELGVIESMGYCDYLCIVEDFLQYGRKLGTENPEQVGLGIGPGRGSAVGSLVCYLVGITSIDPLAYGLLFERFLNPERVSMPDIDSDFGIDIRGQVLEYVKGKYGENAVCNIITKGTLAARASVRAAARVLGDAKYEDAKALLHTGDAIAKEIPAGPNVKLDSELTGSLNAKFSVDKDALEVIRDARLIEGAAINYGMHAAGVIIADNGNVGEYVPLAWNEENQAWMCQCDMVEAEADAGLLKMDFLGLRNLNIITDTLRLVKRNHGIALDIEEIGRELLNNGRTTSFDQNGNVFDKIFSTGKTNGVFQFESGGMKSMLRQFRPSSIHDVILLVAAYRPGPMQYLDDIIKVKHGKAKPRYIVPELKEILGATYGRPIYQEQVMQIFNRIAGFSLGEADIIRRAMSKKKLKVLTDPKTNYQGRFIDGLTSKGANAEDAQAFWDELLEFANYAFNKSHAAAYAHVAFYTAWLKLNYPAEYMTAILNYSTQEKLPMFIAECKEMGIKVLPPDVNRSSYEFDCRDGNILFGLGTIKNVKAAAEEILSQRRTARFHSFKDFIARAHSKNNVTEALIKCGAMDCWCENRAAMLCALPDLAADCKKITDKTGKYQEQLQHCKELYQEKGEEEPFPEKPEALRKSKAVKETEIRKLEKLKGQIDEYTRRFHQTILPIEMPENKRQRLENERELLGMYVSGHPLDDYMDVAKRRSCKICDAQLGEVTLCGQIKNLRRANRKSDGMPMAFFDLEDETGSIQICCFTKAYAEFGHLATEGSVAAVSGKCTAEESIFEDGEPILKIYAAAMEKLYPTKQTVVISVDSMIDWADQVYPQVAAYAGNDYTVLVHDKFLGEMRAAQNLSVSADILQADLDGAETKLLSAGN